MKLGIIARADNTGLGNQTCEAVRHLKPTKTLVVDISDVSPKNLTVRLDRFPGATVIRSHKPTYEDFERFLTGLDVVYTAETPYNYELYTLANLMGVKTIQHVNWEFFDYVRHPELPRPSLFAAPTVWHYDELPEPKALLPVPIASDRFPKQHIHWRAKRFLHVVGYPTTGDRNGTEDLLAALRYIRANVTVTIKTQEDNFVRVPPHPPNVTVVVETMDTPEYWDLYRGHDVLVLPRRYGGLCLPAQEAIGAGLPVVMSDVTPNQWLPQEWRVPAGLHSSIMARMPIDTYRTDPVELAKLIDKFATSTSFHIKATRRALALGAALNWDTLLPQYERCLKELVA